MRLSVDVVIVGCGVSGLVAALSLPEQLRVLVIAKGGLEESNSILAQGGMSVLLDETDEDDYFADTLAAGHGENRENTVRIMIGESRSALDYLRKQGVEFDTDSQGQLDYTREGGHRKRRICHFKDCTGREIITKLLQRAQQRDNVTFMDHTTMVDILESSGTCVGVRAVDGQGDELEIESGWTILATGGVGGLFEQSTSFPIMTGDGCRVAREHGVRLENMDYVQFHPTGLYSPGDVRAVLVSESTRGEGAVLLDAKGERFTDELLPRDVLCEEIRRKMEEEGSSYVRLSFEGLDADAVKARFPGIYESCLERGYDMTREPIPVCPVQHYLMGGIYVDENSLTTMPRLFAVGETSCNGVHGANRLASNSLLESVVFSRRAAAEITRQHAACQTGTA
ncbi:MAG: L-aspartate oxidase [Coriobacteriales bacterium]